jgi:hypothetical protein
MARPREGRPGLRMKLTARALARVFRPGGEASEAAIPVFREAASRALVADGPAAAAIVAWKRVFGRIYGEGFELTGVTGDGPAASVLAAHTTYALILEIVAAGLAAASPGETGFGAFAAMLARLDDGALHERLLAPERSPPGTPSLGSLEERAPFAWYLAAWDARVASAVRAVAQAMSAFERDPSGGDVLRLLYESLVPRVFRRTHGEYQTPGWLAARVLDGAGYQGEPGVRLLDPTCGSGTFLVEAARRVLERTRCSGADPVAAVRAFERDVAGFDWNPLAVLSARTNVLFAFAEILPALGPFSPPVHFRNALAEPSSGGSNARFDIVAGNPPWVRWGFLDRETKDATIEMWRRYGLFSLPPREARLGAGEKDLSMLFTYAAADLWLADGGTLVFVTTREVFSAKGAGEGFRRFRIGADGAQLGVDLVEDLAALRPFDAANHTAILRLRKGFRTRYPVRVLRWRPCPGESKGRAAATLSEVLASTERLEYLANPVDPDRPCSAWAWCDATQVGSLSALKGRSAYVARIGLRAEPYGVYWFRLVSVLADGTALVENLSERGKRPILRERLRLETECLFPAAAGRDLACFGLKSHFYVLCVQDPDRRRGLCEAALARRLPLTAAWLEKHRDLLVSRAAFRKYFMRPGRLPGHPCGSALEPRAPFYSMFNFGLENLAPWRVTWKRMARRMEVSVLGNLDTPLGPKPVLGTDTTSFVACEAEDEAHFLCALLVSAPLGAFVRSFSPSGRGFGTPSILAEMAIPRFDRSNPLHGELSRQSVAAHERRRKGEDVDGARARIDACARSLWGLPPEDTVIEAPG